MTATTDQHAKPGEYVQLPNAPCPKCGLMTEWRRVSLWSHDMDWAICNQCASTIQTREAEWDKARRLQQERQLTSKAPKGFDAVAPSAMRESDPARIPSETMRNVMASYVPGQSFGFMGDPGRGKTRVAYHCLKIAFESGRKVMAQNAVCLARLAKEAAKSEPGAQQELDKHVAVNTLLIDDIGKGQLTPRAAESLYHILDERLHNDRATLWTTNLDFDRLAEFLGEDFGQPIIRRLKEFTEIVIA